MENPIESLLAKSYAPAVLKRLSHFPSRDQMPVASWLVQNPVGTNYALQILEQLEDLARKTEQPPSHCLTGALSSLQDDKLQPKDLGRRVRDFLSKQLHPASALHREAFEECVQSLKLHAQVQVHPPQNFEGSRYKLEVIFESSDELRARLDEILASLGNDGWKRLTQF